MAMGTFNKKNEVNEEETKMNNQVEATNNNQETEVVEVKKKVDWKSVGKKVLIGAGAAAGAVGCFAIGVLTGKATSKPEASAPAEEPDDGAEIIEF